MLGGRPQKKPEPLPVEPNEIEDDELERKLEMLDPTLARRAKRLLDMDFTLEQVMALVRIPDIAHDAEALIDKGCSPDVAFDILAP